MIVVVDYQLGNPGSILNMLKKIKVEAFLTSKPEDIVNADKIILPGVGSFDQGMENLNSLGLFEALNNAVIQKKTPILGICLGAQLMCKNSEEGTLPGFRWINADVVKFKSQANYQNIKIPHIGWCELEINKKSLLFNDFSDDMRFYFVHSFHFQCNNFNDVLATASYHYSFTAGFEKENIFGVQFHPEKSHKFGMQLFKNFSELI
jgi:glutamine amidotransferase